MDGVGLDNVTSAIPRLVLKTNTTRIGLGCSFYWIKKTSDMNLYLPVEVKNRELESRFLLAALASKRGWNAFIGRLDELALLAKKKALPPGVFFEKSVQPQRLKHLETLHDQGFVIVSQDEEGGLLDDSYDAFARKRYSSQTLSFLHRNYCWGTFDLESCSRLFPERKQVFRQTGSPRVDLWRRDFSEFYADAVSQLSNQYGRYVLISSNFGIAHGREGPVSFLEVQKKQGVISTEQEVEDYWRLVHEQRSLIQYFARLIQKIIDEFPDLHVVVRPHPRENDNCWKKILKNVPRCSVIKEGGVTPWILGASAIIHNGCTTAVEAATNKKPVMAYCPFASFHERPFPNRISVRVESIQEGIAFLACNIKDNKIEESAAIEPGVDNIYTGQLKSRYGNVSGRPAVEAILDDMEAIRTCFKTESRTPDAFSAKYSCAVREVRHRLIGRLRMRAHPTIHKFPVMKCHEAEKLEKAASRVYPCITSVRMRRFAGTIFSLKGRDDWA